MLGQEVFSNRQARTRVLSEITNDGGGLCNKFYDVKNLIFKSITVIEKI